jgi:hypothetical protein
MFASRIAAAAGLTRTTTRRAALVLLMPVLALAGGCASYMGAQVTSFHQMTPQRTLEGKRFAVEPSAEQRDSLEFQAYADLVRQALVRHGLVDAAGGNAELAVVIRYSIDNGKAVSYGYPAYGYANYGPVWGWAPYRTPGGGVNYVWTPTYPVSYGVIGTNYANTMLYRRELKVEITERGGDAATAPSKAPGTSPGPRPGRLYEGTVVTEGESASLAPVMPAMVRALFYEFPGVNGASRIVQVRLDQ